MDKIKISVIGLGYVGLPLAALFSTKYQVIGFDINPERIKGINSGRCNSDEIDPGHLRQALDRGMTCTDNIDDIRDCNVYIVAVPTPVDDNNSPDLTPLTNASETVGAVISKGDYVVFESTVYPGTTEEVCIPVIEQRSSLRLNDDFYAGYSPERINPGDHKHTVETIVKITSGSTPQAADFIDKLYDSVLVNGTYRAPSIQVAEAAKVIENAQRDVNIAFINEITKIFNVLGINTNEVIKAAATKWNFLKFHPGLVGGHCIGVDPYYLIQRSMVKGFTPKLMLEARLINDNMGIYAATRVTDELIRRGFLVRDARILILGFTFKEDCRDIRNTKVKDVYTSLMAYTPNVTVYDPVVDPQAVRRAHGIDIISGAADLDGKTFDAIVQCVNHKDFAGMDLKSMLNADGFVFYINEPKSHDPSSDFEVAM